jgi:hypothetical protein
MLRLTNELKRTTGLQARALRKLRLKTQKAAVHLQSLLADDAAEANGHRYRIVEVTWLVSNGAASKVHPQGRAVLAGRNDDGEVWTAVYDPRETLRELEASAIWEVDYSAARLIEKFDRVDVLLPSPEFLIQFARDYPVLVKHRTEQAKAALNELQLALTGLAAEEAHHAKTRKK